jgi:MoaA/NifB/PqqE/SkfB family radical SAM enzyme
MPSMQALSFHRIIGYLIAGRQKGANELKVTGGGEPLLHEDIMGILHLAKGLGYFVYLQTNGILLTEQIRDLVIDIRISYGDGIAFEPPPVRSNGFSYVVTTRPDYPNLNNVIRYAIANDMYVRITQDDTADFDDILDINEIKSHLLKSSNVSYWDVKDYHAGESPCVASIQSPLVGSDGYIYPCCRTQYSQEVVLGYNKDMRMGRDLNKIKPFDGSRCVRCYY